MPMTSDHDEPAFEVESLAMSAFGQPETVTEAPPQPARIPLQVVLIARPGPDAQAVAAALSWHATVSGFPTLSEAANTLLGATVHAVFVDQKLGFGVPAQVVAGLHRAGRAGVPVFVVGRCDPALRSHFLQQGISECVDFSTQPVQVAGQIAQWLTSLLARPR
ncbi:MAG: hypothetical protein AB2A00_39290 [Myxococcota bacterium]